MSLSEADWLRIFIALGVSTTRAAEWAPAATGQWQPAFFSQGMEDIKAMLPQVLHECAHFERLEENLNYTTPERICAVWPSRFPSPEDARPYVRNPEALANKVYGGRMGNHLPGDGWLYRGRSPIHLTGRAAYIRMGELMGQDLESLPQLIETPPYGCELVRRWWENDIPDSMLGDTVRLRRRVNGGYTGLKEVVALAARVDAVLA